MANNNSPFGFRPVSRAGGAPFSTVEYGKPASDAQAIFMGDLAQKVTGAVALPESPTGYNIPTVTSAYTNGTGGPWVGGILNYGAASTLTVHMVTDEIDVLYLVQGKTGTTYSTSSHVGKNASLSTTTAGSTTTKLSGLTLDGATIATTSTLELRIQRVAMISPNVE